MSYRATHDALTGLVNRAEFETRLRRTLDKAHEDRSEQALLYLDLDQFKLVNDACGRSVGDQLLQPVATRLEQALDEDRVVLFAQRIEPLGAGATGLHAEVPIRLLDTDGSLMTRLLTRAIAPDDFGAGASSFGYLKTLKVDPLKFDGSFIKDLIDDPLDAAAVRCFVDVARVLGVKTVAEFVDRPEVLARVRDIGIDYAQAFFLHRPEPINNLLGAGTPLASGPLRSTLGQNPL